MNILLWIFQGLLAVHTAIGAVWKFSHSAEQTMPSLKAIPSGVWLTMSIFELIASVALILPVFSKDSAVLAPFAAIFVGLEMLVLSGVHLASRDSNSGPLFYWLGVLLICLFIAGGRFWFLPSQ